MSELMGKPSRGSQTVVLRVGSDVRLRLRTNEFRTGNETIKSRLCQGLVRFSSLSWRHEKHTKKRTTHPPPHRSTLPASGGLAGGGNYTKFNLHLLSRIVRHHRRSMNEFYEQTFPFHQLPVFSPLEVCFDLLLRFGGVFLGFWSVIRDWRYDFSKIPTLNSFVSSFVPVHCQAWSTRGE